MSGESSSIHCRHLNEGFEYLFFRTEVWISLLMVSVSSAKKYLCRLAKTQMRDTADKSRIFYAMKIRMGVEMQSDFL